MRAILVSFVVLFSSVSSISSADEAFFIVKEILPKQAVLEGKAKDLKAGDKLYFNKSPFEFVVASVKDSSVTITLQNANVLSLGNQLVRVPTEAVKKAIATEQRLKQTLDE